MTCPTWHGSHVAIPTLELNLLDSEITLSPLYHFAEKLTWEGAFISGLSCSHKSQHPPGGCREWDVVVRFVRRGDVSGYVADI